MAVEAVKWAYRILLDREPEDEEAIQTKTNNLRSTRELRLAILGSSEYSSKQGASLPIEQSPVYHYTSTFDPIAIMMRDAVGNRQPRADFLINFLNVAIDPKFFPTILESRAGQVEDLPISANWHADIAEWGAALRAVEFASDLFVMVELGCSGCWMNNTGVAARNTGRRAWVIGIEGGGDHLQFARESLETNGFPADQVELHRGVAAAESGTALLPRHVPGTTWGSEPIFGATNEQRARPLRTGGYDEIPMLSLAQVIAPHERIDLLHIDIQGGEAEVVAKILPLLAEKVAYLVIGTHSKPIEGRLYELLEGTGWLERAAIFDIADGKSRIRVDGVQAWRNPALLPQVVGEFEISRKGPRATFH